MSNHSPKKKLEVSILDASNKIADNKESEKILTPQDGQSKEGSSRRKRSVVSGPNNKDKGSLDQNNLLRESEERLRLALNAGEVGFWDWNLQTGEVILEPTHNRMMGIPQEQTRGSLDQVISRVHSEDREHVIKALESAGKGKTDYNAEFRVVHDDGSVHWIASKGRFYKGNNPNRTRIIGIARDITEYKLAETERESLLEHEQHIRTEAEIANKAKDIFLGYVTHELRAPLSSIVGWTHMLRLNNLSHEERARALDHIERAAIMQRRLIDKLLEASRALSENLELKNQNVELAKIALNVIQTIRPRAEEKNITLHIEGNDKTDVIGDPIHLRNIVYNLLDNAIKFTPKGGSIIVRVVGSKDSKVRLEVSDTGQGINPKWLPKIFDCFGRDELKTIPNSGIGVGLTVTKRLVLMHGGDIEARSKGDGKGSTFIVTLPVLNQSNVADLTRETKTSFEVSIYDEPPIFEIPSQSEHDDHEEVKLDQLKVLVVDDDDFTLELFEIVLSQCGANVRACRSAFEALETLKAWKPDALVCDIGMPEMDGYQLIRKVRALGIEEGGAIPAVAVTAYAGVEDREKALQAGFQMHAPKPITPDTLARIVASLAGSGLSKTNRKAAEKTEKYFEDKTSENRSLQKSLKTKNHIASDVLRSVLVNHLLSSLPEREQEEILSSVEAVSLSSGDILCQPESKIRYVYFPARAVVSLLSITEDGASVEVGMVGREGFVGVPVILGYGQMPSWATVTVGGEAIRIGSEELKRLLRHCEATNRQLLNYTRSLITQISQTVVCNRRHQIEERLCTWLLMIQDRLGKATLPLTQELIAGRLGTRRPGISMILKKLHEDGLVEPSRGSVKVLDRERLKNAACECYAVVKFEDGQKLATI